MTRYHATVVHCGRFFSPMTLGKDSRPTRGLDFRLVCAGTPRHDGRAVLHEPRGRPRLPLRYLHAVHHLLLIRVRRRTAIEGIALMLGHKRVVRGNTAAQTFSLRNRLNDGSLPRVREAVETLYLERPSSESLEKKKQLTLSLGGPGHRLPLEYQRADQEPETDRAAVSRWLVRVGHHHVRPRRRPRVPLVLFHVEQEQKAPPPVERRGDTTRPLFLLLSLK